jgi:hypothetical protein
MHAREPGGAKEFHIRSAKLKEKNAGLLWNAGTSTIGLIM